MKKLHVEGVSIHWTDWTGLYVLDRLIKCDHLVHYLINQSESVHTVTVSLNEVFLKEGGRKQATAFWLNKLYGPVCAAKVGEGAQNIL